MVCMAGAYGAGGDGLHGLRGMETLRGEFPRHWRPRLAEQVRLRFYLVMVYTYPTLPVCMYIFSPFHGRFMSQAVFARSPSDPTAERPPAFLEVYAHPEARPSKDDISGIWWPLEYVCMYVHTYVWIYIHTIWRFIDPDLLTRNGDEGESSPFKKQPRFEDDEAAADRDQQPNFFQAFLNRYCKHAVDSMRLLYAMLVAASASIPSCVGWRKVTAHHRHQQLLRSKEMVAAREKKGKRVNQVVTSFSSPTSSHLSIILFTDIIRSPSSPSCCRWSYDDAGYFIAGSAVTESSSTHNPIELRQWFTLHGINKSISYKCFFVVLSQWFIGLTTLFLSVKKVKILDVPFLNIIILLKLIEKFYNMLLQ